MTTVYSPEEDYIIDYVINQHVSESNNRDKMTLVKKEVWRYLIDYLKKIYRVVRDWREAQLAYHRWKSLAKEKLLHWGNNIVNSTISSIFGNTCEDLKDTEKNATSEDDNQTASEDDDDPQTLYLTPTRNSLLNLSINASQYTEESIEIFVNEDETIDNMRPVDMTEPCVSETSKDSPDVSNIRSYVDISRRTNMMSSSLADFRGASTWFESTSIAKEPESHKKQQTYSDFNNDKNYIHDKAHYNTDHDVDFNEKMNMLKLELFRFQLMAKKQEIKIKLRRKRVKLRILNYQLKIERTRFKKMKDA